MKSEKEKVPLGAKLGLGLLNAVGAVSSRLGKKDPDGKKTATVFTFGSGGPHITQDTYTDAREFTFRIMNAADGGERGTAVFGTMSGEVHAGDTVTCVTADGRRFPCEIREVEQAFQQMGPNTVQIGKPAQLPPFHVLYISGRRPEEFHPHDMLVIETDAP